MEFLSRKNLAGKCLAERFIFFKTVSPKILDSGWDHNLSNRVLLKSEIFGTGNRFPSESMKNRKETMLPFNHLTTSVVTSTRREDSTQSTVKIEDYFHELIVFLRIMILAIPIYSEFDFFQHKITPANGTNCIWRRAKHPGRRLWNHSNKKKKGFWKGDKSCSIIKERNKIPNIFRF
jgi:hypothetical protein